MRRPLLGLVFLSLPLSLSSMWVVGPISIFEKQEKKPGENRRWWPLGGGKKSNDDATT